MSLEVILGSTLPLLYLLFMLAEHHIGKGRQFVDIRFWRFIGLAGLAVSLFVNAIFPPLILMFFPSSTPLDLGGAGLWAAVPTVILTTFLTYWSHRIQHRFDLLWRVGHQLHHAVMRVDIGSAMIFHPIDVAVQATMSLCAAYLLGVTPEAAAISGVAGFAIALFQHLNIRTPQWVGWIIQRPEMHMLHHQRNIHDRNYGDLPLWDLLFGTFSNPEAADVPVGFGEGRSRRVGAMILCRDVHRPIGDSAADVVRSKP